MCIREGNVGTFARAGALGGCGDGRGLDFSILTDRCVYNILLANAHTLVWGLWGFLFVGLGFMGRDSFLRSLEAFR